MECAIRASRGKACVDIVHVLVATGALLLTGTRNTKPKYRMRTGLSQVSAMSLSPPWSRPWFGFSIHRRTQPTQLFEREQGRTAQNMGYVPLAPGGWASVVHQTAHTFPDTGPLDLRSPGARPPGTGHACSFLTSAPLPCSARIQRLAPTRRAQAEAHCEAPSKAQCRACFAHSDTDASAASRRTWSGSHGTDPGRG